MACGSFSPSTFNNFAKWLGCALRDFRVEDPGLSCSAKTRDVQNMTFRNTHLPTVPHESSEIKPGFFQITVLTMDFFRYLQFSPGFFRDLQVFFQVNPGFCIEPPTSLPWRRSVPWTTVAPAIRAIHLGRCVGPPNVWREMPWPCWITWDGPLGTESFQCQGTGNWELLGFYVLCILCIITYVYTYTHIYYIVLYIYIFVCVMCVCARYDMY